MAEVLKLKAKRASEKAEKQRKLEKARAMKQVAKAGIIAVLEGCVDQAREKLIKQFNHAVAPTQSEIERLGQQIEGFDPKTNVEHYQKLVKNVLAILEDKDSDFYVSPIEPNTDSKSEVTEQELLTQTMQNVDGNMTPDIRQFMNIMMKQMGQGSLNAQTVAASNGLKDSVVV